MGLIDLFPQLFSWLETGYTPFWHGNAITLFVDFAPCAVLVA